MLFATHTNVGRQWDYLYIMDYSRKLVRSVTRIYSYKILIEN